jgi:CSLREA domain-containing protein
MRAALAAAMAAAFVLALSTAARTETIVVNSLADPGAAGTCGLRDAITAANTMKTMDGCAAGKGHDTIRFHVTGTIRLASTLPQVTGNLTIDGPVSPGITIDGGNAVQVPR